MGTVQEFPTKGNPMSVSGEALADMLKRAVDARVGCDATFERREAAALALTTDATRLFLAGDLKAISDHHGPYVEVDGLVYKRHEPGTVRYYSLCGAMDLERWTYRAVGVHNGPTIVPLDLEAGVVERTTPALGLRIMLGYAKDHMRSAEEDMTADHRCPPSRSTLERVAKAMGTAATQVAPQIERRVRQAERVPDGAVAIALGGLNDYGRIVLALGLESYFRERRRPTGSTGQPRPSSKLTNHEQRDVRKDIAGEAGVSTGNLTKVKQLLETVIPEVRERLLRGEVSIHRAWRWRTLSPKRQRDALWAHVHQGGIKKTVSRLVRAHADTAAPAQPADVAATVLAGLPMYDPADLTVAVVDVPGRAVVVTRACYKELQQRHTR